MPDEVVVKAEAPDPPEHSPVVVVNTPSVEPHVDDPKLSEILSCVQRIEAGMVKEEHLKAECAALVAATRAEVEEDAEEEKELEASAEDVAPPPPPPTPVAETEEERHEKSWFERLLHGSNGR